MTPGGIYASIKIPARQLLYHWQYAFMWRRRKALDIRGPEETVRFVIEHGCSVCRFGDGEIEMITNLEEGWDESRRSAFQEYDPELATRLREILRHGCDESLNVIVCLPRILTDPKEAVWRTRRFMERCFVNNHRTLETCTSRGARWFDTNFTRFYMDFRDKDKAAYIQLCRRIWGGRELCIIEGEQSRLGVGNDLFAGARSIERILCPAVNAFSRYDKILQAALKVQRNKLILIALGQTATVLAYDLAQAGFQAIDIGHIDIEYEWFLMGARKKVPIPHKYVNEVKEGRQFTDETDRAYLSQIKERIR